MKTVTFDIPARIKTSIGLTDEELKDFEEFCKKRKSEKGKEIIKIISDGLKKSDRKISDLVEDSGFKKELKYEVIKTLLDFLGTHNLSSYVREELKKRIKREGINENKP